MVTLSRLSMCFDILNYKTHTQLSITVTSVYGWCQYDMPVGPNILQLLGMMYAT